MSENILFIPVYPIAKPRMTRSDKWKKRPSVVQYYKYKDELRKYIPRDYELPSACRLIFRIPFPNSYSQTKKNNLNCKPHQIKPDLDNLVKAIFDCLCVQDQYIADCWASKRWTDTLELVGVTIAPLSVKEFDY